MSRLRRRELARKGRRAFAHGRGHARLCLWGAAELPAVLPDQGHRRSRGPRGAHAGATGVTPSAIASRDRSAWTSPAKETIAVAEVFSRRFLSKSRGRWHISIAAGTNRRAAWEAPTLLFHQIGMCSRAW